MPSMVGVSQAIDQFQESREKGHRPHLGASQVGKPCERALVYGFRHATPKKTAGRMLRLFSRGHKEEISICGYLRDIGFEVREFAQRLVLNVPTESYQAHEWDDPECFCWPDDFRDVSHDPAHVAVAQQAGIKLRQWAFSDIGGHHAGSGDGKFMNPSTNLRQFPAIPPDTWGNLEFKTYNEKSFNKLWAAHEAIAARQGNTSAVREVKPEHYSQMQEYMHYMQLPFSLYMAVCKNDDRLYDEVVWYDEQEALRCVELARRAISARQLPPRISNNATNFNCKFCDHRAVCHFGQPMAKSCRTCRHGVAVTEGDAAEWTCAQWNMTIPRDFVPVGCDSWSTLTD